MDLYYIYYCTFYSKLDYYLPMAGGMLTNLV